jgi:CTP synthase
VGILREIGIIPDILVCRCERPMAEEHRRKLSLFCNVRQELVIEEQDVANSIYEVPVELAKQSLDQHILGLFGLPANELRIDAWHKMLAAAIHPKRGTVEIAVVGKYIRLKDSYKSIFEALTHAGIANQVKIEFRFIEAEDIETRAAGEMLSGVHGVLVPGGFGDRGVPGKINAIRYARENRIPFLGICLGMQCAVIEFARNACGMEGASSTEFDPGTKYPVIDLMESQKQVSAKGGTMRLGAYPCVLSPGSEAAKAYGETNISERHRHRFEFNSAFRPQLEARGMSVCGVNPDSGLVEMVEIAGHPWFVACQFHPEFKSTPLNCHPLFRGFVKAAMANRRP